MAQCLLSEEQVQCFICQDVFSEPVSTPCGHNFCMACITGYWDNNDFCQCPLCKRVFDRRPYLLVNTFIEEMAAQFRQAVQLETTEPGEGPCGVFIGTKRRALESHREPQQIDPALKRHKLTDPVKDPEHGTCQKHDGPLQMFCRTDQMLVCRVCTETDHQGHHAVPVEEECGQRKAELGRREVEVQQMIQERQQKIQEIKDSIELSRRDTLRETENGAQIKAFTALMDLIKDRQASLIRFEREMRDMKHEAVKRRGKGFVKELEQEISLLQTGNAELKQLSEIEDHLHFIQTSQSPCMLLPTKNWSEIRVYSPVCKGDVRLAVSQRQLMEETVKTVSLLQEKLRSGLKNLRDAELKSVQCVAVDVTLDPDTAHARLGIFKDGREVRHRCNKRNVTDHLGRFGLGCCVLGKEGFSSGRFYYEVLVRGKTRWELGVARESMDRKKRAPLVPHERLWTLGLRSRNKYSAISKKAIHLSLSEVPEKVGVFVDYEGGQVSFYDVGNISHIYSFTGCTFAEKLYPYFCPFNKKDANEAPLVISPVKDSHSSSDSYSDKDSSMDSD